GTLGAAAGLSVRTAAAEDERPGNDKRPQPQDLLVVADGEHQGEVIKPGDLKLGDPPRLAWPKDPGSSVVRDGSRLNELLVVRLAPEQLDEVTRPRAADGIVA